MYSNGLLVLEKMLLCWSVEVLFQLKKNAMGKKNALSFLLRSNTIVVIKEKRQQPSKTTKTQIRITPAQSIVRGFNTIFSHLSVSNAIDDVGEVFKSHEAV